MHLFVHCPFFGPGARAGRAAPPGARAGKAAPPGARAGEAAPNERLRRSKVAGAFSRECLPAGVTPHGVGRCPAGTEGTGGSAPPRRPLRRRRIGRRLPRVYIQSRDCSASDSILTQLPSPAGVPRPPVQLRGIILCISHKFYKILRRSLSALRECGIMGMTGKTIFSTDKEVSLCVDPFQC